MREMSAPRSTCGNECDAFGLRIGAGPGGQQQWAPYLAVVGRWSGHEVNLARVPVRRATPGDRAIPAQDDSGADGVQAREQLRPSGVGPIALSVSHTLAKVFGVREANSARSPGTGLRANDRLGQ